MPLNSAGLKSKMQERIFQGLKREFTAVGGTENYSPVVEQQWRTLAAAISDIAMDIVTAMQTEAQVLPGQGVTTAGSPTNQAGSTITPGKII